EHDETTTVLTAPLERAIADGVAAGRCVSPSPGRDARVIFDYVFAALRSVLLRDELADSGTTDDLVSFTLRALGARDLDRRSRVDPSPNFEAISASVDDFPSKFGGEGQARASVGYFHAVT